MKHLRRLAATLVLAVVVVQLAHGLTLFAHSLSTAHAISCDWPGVPFAVVDACRTGLVLATWGQQ